MDDLPTIHGAFTRQLWPLKSFLKPMLGCSGSMDAMYHLSIKKTNCVQLFGQVPGKMCFFFEIIFCGFIVPDLPNGLWQTKYRDIDIE